MSEIEVQDTGSVGRGDARDYGGGAGDSNEAQLCYGTRRPSIRCLGRDPTGYSRVHLVLRPEESQENVDVEKSHGRQCRTSSSSDIVSAASSSCTVIVGVSAGLLKM
jgi:hypothetical protein